MTINANVADTVVIAANEADPEAAAIRGFWAIVALVLVANVAAFSLFGLAGVGALAVTEAALMLVLCIFLTRG